MVVEILHKIQSFIVDDMHVSIFMLHCPMRANSVMKQWTFPNMNLTGNGNILVSNINPSGAGLFGGTVNLIS